MTQKELSYMEDAIGHETNIISICNDIIERLDDEELISFVENEENLNEKMKEKLFEKLQEKANE